MGIERPREQEEERKTNTASTSHPVACLSATRRAILSSLQPVHSQLSTPSYHLPASRHNVNRKTPFVTFPPAPLPHPSPTPVVTTYAALARRSRSTSFFFPPRQQHGSICSNGSNFS